MTGVWDYRCLGQWCGIVIINSHSLSGQNIIFVSGFSRGGSRNSSKGGGGN